MIPTYMLEDSKFTKLYKYVEDIFTQIKETCEDIKNNVKVDINSLTYLKLLSVFGQTSSYTGKGFIYEGLHYIAETNTWRLLFTDTKESIDINLSGYSLYYASKFNTLKNNFDGTFKSLKTSLQKTFNNDQDYINVDSIIQKTVDNYPYIEINIGFDPELNSLFPPAEAYPSPVSWNINNIKNEWINANEENKKKYDNYKQVLELLTLYTNGYFNINILGVIIVYKINNKVPQLVWDESYWNESYWNSSTEQGGE